MKNFGNVVKTTQIIRKGKPIWMTSIDNHKVKCKICGRKFARMTGLVIHSRRTTRH